jgi:hypothetical protein
MGFHPVLSRILSSGEETSIANTPMHLTEQLGAMLRVAR